MSQLDQLSTAVVSMHGRWLIYMPDRGKRTKLALKLQKVSNARPVPAGLLIAYSPRGMSRREAACE